MDILSEVYSKVIKFTQRFEEEIFYKLIMIIIHSNHFRAQLKMKKTFVSGRIIYKV